MKTNSKNSKTTTETVKATDMQKVNGQSPIKITTPKIKIEQNETPAATKNGTVTINEKSEEQRPISFTTQSENVRQTQQIPTTNINTEQRPTTKIKAEAIPESTPGQIEILKQTQQITPNIYLRPKSEIEDLQNLAKQELRKEIQQAIEVLQFLQTEVNCVTRIRIVLAEIAKILNSVSKVRIIELEGIQKTLAQIEDYSTEFE